MARKITARTETNSKPNIVPPDGEPRIVGHPDDAAIWGRIHQRGIPASALDAALTGRDDRGYSLARKHTAARDGGRYQRWPRVGHLIVWAEQLDLPLDRVAALFGYDTSTLPAAPVTKVAYTVDVTGHTDDAGRVRPAPPGERAALGEPVEGASALRTLAPLPGFGLPTDALIIWKPVGGVVPVSGRLCLARVLHSDSLRLAWVSRVASGGLCNWNFYAEPMQRGPLHTCEPVDHVLHPAP